MHIKIALTLISAALLGGCTAEQQADARLGWERGVATGTRIRNEVVLPLLASTLEVAGTAAAGYAQGYSDYYATHPTVYVQPSYIQPMQPQHGTITVMPTWRNAGDGPTFINY
jgi:hypothetical protein